METTLEANKRLIREHYEQLVNRKNLAAADDQLAPDFVDLSAPPGTPRGPEAARQAMQRLHAALPDVWVTLDEVIAEGERVAVRATWSGTHMGTLFGQPPSGRKVTLTGMVFWRVANGRIVERSAMVDLSGLKPPGVPGISGILETAVYVNDLEQAESFYGGILGLKKIFAVPRRQLVFRCGDGVLLVFDPDRARTEEVVIDGGVIPLHGTTGAGHVAFQVKETELGEWRERFRVAGVAIESEVSWPNGAHSVYFRDPAGNCLELATPRLWDFPIRPLDSGRENGLTRS